MNLRPFELALVIGSLIMAIVALFILATYTPPPDDTVVSTVQGNVTIWGMVPATAVRTVIDQLYLTDASYANVTYQYVNPETFDTELVNALADGYAPDLLFIPHERLAQLQRRLRPISYESFPVADYRALYLDGASLFAYPEGIYALPVMVDPLVMYWNRNMLFNQQLLEPPQTWEALMTDYFPKLIDRSDDRTITRPVMAMGAGSNIRNSYGMFSALLLQAGSRMVVPAGNQYQVLLSTSNTPGVNPLQQATNFYLGFANPSNPLYTWNRSLPEDRSMFVRGDMAFYFGYGSEASRIAALNPNLNFDMAELPQGASATVRRTYGRLYGVAIMNSSPNPVSAERVAFELANYSNSATIAASSEMVPLLRSLVAASSDDVYGRIRYNAAPVAYGWLNPNYRSTESIITQSLEDINANRASVSGGTGDMAARIQLSY